MNKGFSIYLDFVRFAAACLVYIYHSSQRFLVQDPLPASNYGHSSVIVFFVLSGYVISYVSSTKENDWIDYASSRISRIYSVAVPAVLLTLVLDFFGRQFYPEIYQYPFDKFIVRIAASLLVANEIWFVSITTFSNVPYWSICYEMWYYMAFGILIFLPRWIAAPLLIGLALLLGPKILVLAPVWAAGVVLQRWRALHNINQITGWVLMIGSAIGIVAFHAYGVESFVTKRMKDFLGPDLHTEMTFSKYFLSDYLLGALVVLNFAGMRKICERIGSWFIVFESPIRLLASYTLTLYLLHQPLFLFWGAVIKGDPTGHFYWWVVTLLMALSVVAVAKVTENQRHGLKILVQKVLEKMGRRSRMAA